MNSLFTCSWQKNVNPINEQTWIEIASQILTEAAGEGGAEAPAGEADAKTPGKRGKPADPRYARMMGMQSVKELAGTMTPRYFATKVLRQLEQDYPDKKIEDITDDEIQSAMNLVANISRKLATRSDIKLSTAKASDMPKAEEKLKKGKTGFETLNLNLTPDTDLTFEDESPMGHGIYTTVKDGLKYRVAVKNASGKPMKLSQLTPDSVASVVVVEPAKKEMVSAPTVGDLEAPKVPREKPVADFPAEGEGDFSGPDPEDLARGKAYEMDEDDDEDEDKKKKKEEDCEWASNPETVVVKKSPKAINKMMKEAYNKKLQNRFNHERRNTLGY